MLVGVVAGMALYRARPAEIPALRRRPGPVPEGWSRTPVSLLRYADEQTVAGTAAVFQAIAAMGASPDAFEGWGIVAASRYLGRANLAAALRSFGVEGVWGTSPHLIPHFALHSPSGTISLALGLRGPNLGVGGGLHAATEGFLAALTWLSAGVVPGVWLVLSGWSPELVPSRPGDATDARGEGDAEIECQALALALRPAGAREDGRDGLSVRLRVDGSDVRAPAPVDLVRLADELVGRTGRLPRTIATDPSGRVRVELIAEE
ncbi:MAG: hypothetical protein ACYC61_15775 [Isosphaeraceae bacterium]